MIVHNSLYLLAWMTLTDHNQSLAISKQLFEKWFESVTGRRSKQPLLRSKISNEEKNPTLIGRGISKFVLIEFLNSLGETFVYIYHLCSTRHSVITLSVNLQQERDEKKNQQSNYVLVLLQIEFTARKSIANAKNYTYAGQLEPLSEGHIPNKSRTFFSFAYQKSKHYCMYTQQTN